MRLAIFLFLFCTFRSGLGVDPKNFKTCEESSFCRRCRKVQPGNSKYALVEGSMHTYSNAITADLINKDTNHLFVVKLEALLDNTFRILIDEKEPLRARYRVEHVLVNEPHPGTLTVEREDKKEIVLVSGTKKAVVAADPFRVDFYENNVLVVSANARGLMNFEHLRPKPQINVEEGGEEGENKVNQASKLSEDNDPGAWEENFKSHHDEKPLGPEAVALDFVFPEADVLFGIPEHADSFVLKSTSGGDPYRLYNLDVFEYEIESKMALYGSVPVLYGHGTQRSAGVYWQNAAETWVDIYTGETNVVSSIVNKISGARNPLSAHFMSESGIIDAFVLLGPKPLDTFKQYTSLTGTARLPQLYTLAYHQCRWNYKDATDVETVSTKFDEYDIPMDIMWLDIEYTDKKKYFTWDPFNFPDPLKMIKNLTDVGRHLVIIIDPHIKRDDSYFFHNYCTQNGYYVRNREGKEYDGWCWPGSVSYPDFFRKDVRDYYAEQYLLSNFKDVTSDVMFWNDMNEPSVFNGPEVTMPKDLIHYGGWEHRDVHNLYGHMHIMATYDGLIKRNNTQRPFILTRAHFAGSQRYAAIWTGDNMASWSHLEHSIKMCLSEAVAGFSFCGADVGGFFNDPDDHLIARWYQAGAFLPFFRSHAHIDTKRREPWLFAPETRLIIRNAIRKRYSYLPLWYTMFYEHEIDGSPVIRPMLAHYPKDKDCFAIDNQFLLQDRLLVRPVMAEGVNNVDVYFPAGDDKIGDLWYDVDDFQKFDKHGKVNIPVNDNKIPVYQRGGSIVPKKERIRRASTLMTDDPYTIVICLDRSGKAQGTLYLDDETSFEYIEKNKYVYVNYKFENSKLTNEFVKPANYDSKSYIERVIIAGLHRMPKSASLTVDGLVQLLEVLPYQNGIAVRYPGVSILKDFEIKLNY